MTHTKGPWKFEYLDGDKSSPITAKSKHLQEDVCIIPHDDITEKSEEELLANARLISAAPDLLEALRHCLREHGGYTIRGETERMAKAAILKATGE